MPHRRPMSRSQQRAMFARMGTRDPKIERDIRNLAIENQRLRDKEEKIRASIERKARQNQMIIQSERKLVSEKRRIKKD